MKNYKQVSTLFVVLAVVSIITGCGKAKNNDPNGIGVAGAFAGIPGGGTGTLTMSNATGAVYGTLPVILGGGIPGGTNVFIRPGNQAGDTLALSLASGPVSGGVGSTQVQAAVRVNLGASSVAFFQYYCGGQQPTNATINSYLVSGNPGTISMSVWVSAQNGCGLAI